MEKRRETLSALKVCRFCLAQNASLDSLYDRRLSIKETVDLTLKILSCVSIEVFPSDKMPSYICSQCIYFMDLFYKYKQIVRKADENLLKYIQNGVQLESVPWPSSLVKAYQNTHRQEVMKTVVEGGATIQVSTHDSSESDDEDDENVFNVTIAEGSDEGSKGVSTCIKVVTSKENEDRSKSSLTQDAKDINIVESKGNVVTQHVVGLKDGCWSCDQCNCTYPLKQLLSLHKMQKHRERTVNCNQCDDKFFNKYDLAVHQVRHTDERPFKCVACDKKFKRLLLLKRHVKVIHSDLLKKICPKCPATFLSKEELQAHEKKHSLKSRKRYGCGCGKKYINKDALERHKMFVRCRNHDFSCEYCPQQFSSLSNLARHVRSHAGDKPYPCKHCNKSFTKSHHYTRHLRLKHHEAVRSSHGPFGQTDHFSCDQCDDSFATQDELIYHSAIHATQNLTCPLCDEKFENVDAVTIHIKSHVNGVEFMCDFCELVFITKEKLESHLIMAHEDEFNNELGQDDSSMEMDPDDDDDDNSINVKDEGDHMVIEIKKADDYMLHNTQGDSEEKCDNTNSEDSDVEVTYSDLSTEDMLDIVKNNSQQNAYHKSALTNFKLANVTSILKQNIAKDCQTPEEAQTSSIIRKDEEVKSKPISQQIADIEKKVKPNKADSNTSVGASNKSLQLLEKELQELKRTNNTRSEVNKSHVKSTESIRGRRPQLHASTPKIKSIEEKKISTATKVPITDKKLQERRIITKENKEPKEIKDTKLVNAPTKEERDVKDRESTPTPKSVVKNGNNDKTSTDEGIRRSTRPSKIKDYAKMIRDRSLPDDEDSNDTDDDEEYIAERIPEKPKNRKSITKTQPKMIHTTPSSIHAPVVQTPPAMPTPRKRGRPRKEPLKEVPAKVKKDTGDENILKKTETEEPSTSNSKSSVTEEKPDAEVKSVNSSENSSDDPKLTISEQTPPAGGILVPLLGQTLKKVPVKSLPPGVKALPLPVTARPLATGELCEMQIGKKMVKVQKIVMTKAEVEAMAKKGLVEMKDGTMVLKQGIKLPTADAVTIKSTLIGETDVGKESLQKKEKGAPSRCDLEEDV